VKVYVKTPARLHLGLIDLNGNLGRVFGGLGVGIDSPNVVIKAERSENFSVVGKKTELAKTFAKRFFETYNIKAEASINVKQIIPEHEGLGSGTQLTLAIAAALARLFNLKASVQELSEVMGRGKRTSVGTTIFEKGGFVVDGGKKLEEKRFPVTIFHKPFPQNWRFVVAIPNVNKGLARNEETAAFKRLPPMNPKNVGKICRLIIMKLLPAIVEADIKSFGEALTQIQIIIGNYFAEVQGGTYASETANEGIALLQKLGAYGAGQSSWGPTFYGITRKEKSREIELGIKEFLRKDVGGQVFVAKANNRGACIRVTKY
jgi:beta-ribofuranosylaminobenzene 5'-phosphate synthase